MLEIGQGLLQLGDVARLRGAVELLLQPRGEYLRLHSVLNKTLTMIIILILMIRVVYSISHLYKLSNILSHHVGLVTR